ncbi:Uncharacterized protein Adt_36894 [Abeliophyllum distichum]|uniref:Uncharacterized protein n=1 Tax=Abeliophyllum distichum TaxID=126358 RepID=A0ABD1QJ55_9LAMI
MATSVFMASDHNTNTYPQTSIHPPEDHDHQPIRRSTGRRKPKGNEAMGQKKKRPQRGMGVAQLEKLREQEGRNQTLSISPASFSNLTVMNPNSVPVQYAKLGGFGTVNGGVGQIGLNQNQSLFGFQEQMGNSSVLVSNHFQVDPFGVGGSNLSFGLKNASENSKELSSTPNSVKCYYEHCNVCHKKKRVNGEILGCSRSGMYMQMPPIGNCDFLGLNVGDNESINQENQEVGIQAPIVPLAGYSVRNCQPGVEVVAFHRKGNSSSGNGTVLMEYDFFPGNGGSRSTCNNELALMNLGGNSEPSSQGGETSSSIDLSLKLSY